MIITRKCILVQLHSLQKHICDCSLVAQEPRLGCEKQLPLLSMSHLSCTFSGEFFGEFDSVQKNQNNKSESEFSNLGFMSVVNVDYNVDYICRSTNV